MSLTQAQILTLRAHILANTDPVVIAARIGGDMVTLTDWYAAPSTTLAWKESADANGSAGAPNYSTYDSLAAGKRDSWAIFIQHNQDFTKNKVRNWITDIWGAATAGSNSEAVLQAGTEFANRGETVFGGNSATTGTVTAIKRNWVGIITMDEISSAVNG